MKPYVVKRFRLYTHLKEKGFKEISIRPDKYNPKYFVWIFDYTDALKNEIDNFYKIGY
jgi:hypothetical protein